MTYKTFGFCEEQVLMRDSLLGLLGRVLPDEKIRTLESAGAAPAARLALSPGPTWHPPP